MNADAVRLSYLNLVTFSCDIPEIFEIQSDVYLFNFDVGVKPDLAG